MREMNGQQAKTNPRKILLKKNCWIETNFGVFQIKDDLIAEATPMFLSNGELASYRFNSSSFAGVTYDLERTVVFDNERTDLGEFKIQDV